MILCRLFILVCLSTTAWAFHIDEGCEAKSQWKEDVLWLEFRIGAWVPSDATEIIQLLTEFHTVDESLYNDKIIISRNNYEFIKTRDIDEKSELYNTSVVLQDGWNEFLLQIDKNYTMWYTNEYEKKLLMEHEIDYKSEYLIITGKNITLNCPSRLRMWKVSEEPVVMPLDKSNPHRICFYSDEKMKPSIKLGNRTISLGWNGHSISTVDKQPLPPYQLYNISLTCGGSSRITCKITVDDQLKEEIPMSMIPDSISFRKGDSGPYSVMLPDSDPYLPSTSTPYDNTTSTQRPNTRERITIIAIIISIPVTVIIIGIGCLIFCLLKKRRRRARKAMDEVDSPRERQSLISRSTRFTVKEDVLTDAVMQNNLQHVKTMLSKSNGTPRNYEKAYYTAHLLCRTDILKKFESTKRLEREPTIKWVQKEYSERVTKIFRDAQKGRYQQVVSLLQLYEIPATIRDEQGRSLLHVIASAKDNAGGPQWTADNLREFLELKTYYTNAVDFKGRTCLHLLCDSANNSRTSIFWDGKERTSELAWVELAQILVQCGCDPTIRDGKGELPHERAEERRFLELSGSLKENCQQFSTERKKIEFKELVKRAQRGTKASLMEAMKCHRELLPLRGSLNPLTEAATRGHLEATMLLLSGGASICGLSQVSITPLEAVHTVKSLPAIFPAIMRRECINQLKFEKKETGQEEKWGKLHEYQKSLISNMENGQITKIINPNRDSNHDESKEARELLCLAAEHGMTLTCQMLGLENVNLQPFNKEDKPVLKAIQNGQHEVITVLYRDLQMSPFAQTDTDKISKAFLKEIWNDEFNQLQNCCETKENPVLHKECMEIIRKAHNGETVELTEKKVFSCIARFGLDYIFHSIKRSLRTFDINAVVDDLTGCTMLHIAAMYGRFSMVEYLLYDKALDIMAKSKGEFTAAHLAAIKGHKECMKYLQFYMQKDHGLDDDLSTGGQTASDFSRGYGHLVEDSKLIFLPEDMGLEIWSTPSPSNKTKILLEKKFEQYKISDDTSFFKFVKSFTKHEKARTITEILEEMESLLNDVCVTDDRFIGNIDTYNTNCDGLDIPFESMQIYWEVNSPQFNHGEIKHNVTDQHCSISVKFSSEESNFTGNFYEAVKNTMNNFTFKSSLIWLLYPSIKREKIGVTLLLQIYENARSRLVSVLLIPVLKTDYPEENKSKFIHPIFREMEPTLYLANINDDKWIYVTKKIEDDIIDRLKENQRLVLLGCQLLIRILYSCWWYPILENRRHINTWKSYAIKLETLPDRVLTSLFLEEINSTNEEDWFPSKFLERMIIIFKRAVIEGKDQPQRGKTVRLFLDNPHSYYECNIPIHPIIQFLENLKAKSQYSNDT